MRPTNKQYTDVAQFMLENNAITLQQYTHLLQYAPTEQSPAINPLKPHIAQLLEQRRKNRR